MKGSVHIPAAARPGLLLTCLQRGKSELARALDSYHQLKRAEIFVTESAQKILGSAKDVKEREGELN